MGPRRLHCLDTSKTTIGEQPGAATCRFFIQMIAGVRSRQSEIGADKSRLRVLGSEVCVELCNERVCVCTVNEASHFDAFAAGSGAAEAVHTDFKEEFRGFAVCVKNIADDGVLCDFHFLIPTFLSNYDGFKKSVF